MIQPTTNPEEGNTGRWRRRFLCLALHVGLGALATARGNAPVEQSDVFVSRQGGYQTYRIPAVVRSARGTLLAFCEGRKDNARDAGRIDLLLRRSSDGGATWGPVSVVWADGANTCGNPCPVVDRSTGKIWLLASHNPGSVPEAQINANPGAGTRTVWVLNSADDGLTWSRAEEITAAVKRPDWRWYATGPGVGIQLAAGPHAGRLVIPCDYSRPGGGGSHVIYSDDHGGHWRIGGTLEPKLNESQVAELPDDSGAMVLSMRSNSGRQRRVEAFSRDGGITWSAPADVADLPDPVCQGSIIAFGPTLLFSNPSDEHHRRNLTVHLSTDGGHTWPRALVLNPGFAAYSCLVGLDAHQVGCLYENGARNASERISFARFTVASLF